MSRLNNPELRIRLDNLCVESLEPGPPVLVVGMHNAGTSILTEIIHRCGVFMCPDMPHHECRYFTHFIHDDLLLGSREKWAELPIMSVEKTLAFEPLIKDLITRCWLPDYLRFGYDGVSPWGVKDPRLCIFLPLYLKLFPEAKVVHIHRDPEDIAASLTRRPKKGIGIETDIDFWRKLTAAYQARCAEFVPQFRQHYELSYEKLCTDGESEVKPLLEFLDVPVENATPDILGKLSPKRIGSHQRYLAEGEFGKFRRNLASWVYRLIRPETSGK